MTKLSIIFLTLDTYIHIVFSFQGFNDLKKLLMGNNNRLL